MTKIKNIELDLEKGYHQIDLNKMSAEQLVRSHSSLGDMRKSKSI